MTVHFATTEGGTITTEDTEDMSANGREQQKLQDDFTAQRAIELLKRDREQRIVKCQMAIEAALQEHRCRLDVVVVLRAGSVEPQVRIVAVD